MNESNMFPDLNSDLAAQQAQLARRRELAKQLVSRAMTPGDQGQMVSGIYVPGYGGLTSLASGAMGGALNSQTDRQEQDATAKQALAQNEWQISYNDAPDDQTRQQLLTTARNKGLRYDLESAFRKEEATKVERGEQLAADRTARAELAAQAAEQRAEAARMRSEDVRLSIEQRREAAAEAAQLRREIAAMRQQSGGAQSQPKPPSGYRWTEDGQLAPIPGGPADKAGRPVNLTAAQQKAVGDSDALIGHIDAALESIKTNPNAIGFRTVVPDVALARIDPEGVAARAAVAGLSAEKVHQLSGAAVSPAEFARLRPYLPASGDSAAAARDKLTNLRAELVRIREIHARGPTRAQPNPGGATGGWDAPTQAPAVPTVVRTGRDSSGRKVEQLSDGSIRYGK